MPELLAERVGALGLELPPDAMEKLLRYQALLLKENQVQNLISDADASDAALLADRHFVDALAPLREAGLFPRGAKVIDVGSGAGFPGLALAITRPDLSVTLLDATRKRTRFLEETAAALGLANTRVVTARAEDAARMPAERAAYDLAVARAVAPLNTLLEYLLPFVRVSGWALCYKGAAALEEADAAARAARTLGGRMRSPIAVAIAGRDWTRYLVPCEKIAETPPLYPRKAGTPKAKPL